MPPARSTAPTTQRPMRADARRNREAILRAARATFEEEGVLASIDGIASRAGVGNATLYRSFPTREDLLAAVMQTSVEAATAEAEELAASSPPGEALAEWLVRLAWRLRIWHDLPYCVASAHGDPESSMAPATNPLLAATAALVDRAREAGAVHDEVSGEEAFELATALSWGVDRFGDDEATARRRVRRGTAGLFR